MSTGTPDVSAARLRQLRKAADAIFTQQPLLAAVLAAPTLRALDPEERLRCVAAIAFDLGVGAGRAVVSEGIAASLDAILREMDAVHAEPVE
jgi:hypothetical protein